MGSKVVEKSCSLGGPKMWHVNFPKDGAVDEVSVNAILPTGFRAEKCSFDHYDVYQTEPRRLVGSVTVDYASVTVAFDNDTEEGKAFAAAWALIHSGYDPKQVLFGFVYQSPDGSFQLDKMPEVMESLAVDQIGNYVSSDNTFMVSFMRGDWDLGFLSVLTIKAVLRSGKLAEDIGPMLLHLGNIENAATM